VDSTKQSDRETYRVVVFSPDRTDVLLVADEAGFMLPAVEIPRWQRTAETLTRTVRTRWGCDAICLFLTKTTQPSTYSGGDHYLAMECCRYGEGNDDNGVWTAIRSLFRDRFRDAADYMAIQQCLAEGDSYANDKASPFARWGWFEELRTWTAEVIRPLGLRLGGPFCQFNATPSYSLIRFETSGPAVWFKAVGEPSLREFSITLTLSHLFPRFLPVVLAARPEWHGWLTQEFEGSALENFSNDSSWRSSVRTLGDLQTESVGLVDQLLSAGCRDLRCPALLGLVDPFLEVMGEIMKLQTKTPPMPLDRGDLLTLAADVKDAIVALAELEIPDALGHLDLNPGNILTSAARCVFLDWADAYVGPPFLTFEYLRAYVFREGQNSGLLESALARSYAEQWTSCLAPQTIAKAYELAPLVAVFAYASGTEIWRDPARLRECHLAGYFRSLTRRMFREAEALPGKTPASFPIHAG
jgi:hypothetical protein